MQPANSAWVYLLIPICGGLFAVGFGSLFVIMSLRARKQSQAAQGWPAAPGRVTGQSMHTSTNFSSNGSMTVSYQPEVTYEYNVLGSAYQGQRVAFGADSFGKRQAEAVLAKYPTGAAVTVYYNPQAPSEAVLERAPRGDTIFLLIGGFFALIGLCICGIGSVMALFMLSAR